MSYINHLCRGGYDRKPLPFLFGQNLDLTSHEIMFLKKDKKVVKYHSLIFLTKRSNKSFINTKIRNVFCFSQDDHPKMSYRADTNNTR